MSRAPQKKNIRRIVIIIFIIIAAILYLNFNPELVKFFPPCIFKVITGYKCPGCGSQRAIHHLLNLDITSAFLNNPLLVLSLPYMFLGLLLEYSKFNSTFPRIKKILFGRIAIYVVFVIVVTYWVIRNIYNF